MSNTHTLSFTIAIVIPMLLIIACAGQASGIAAQDAEIKRLIALYFEVDISKVGDRAIVPACGRMAIENEWNTKPELYNKYRFMFPTEAQHHAYEVATHSILAVTGDTAQTYCESKLQEHYVEREPSTPTPKWKVDAGRISLRGTLPEGLRRPPDSPDENDLAQLIIACSPSGRDITLAFGWGVTIPEFFPDQARYIIDGSDEQPLDTINQGPDNIAQVKYSQIFAAKLRNAQELTFIAPRTELNGTAGPDLRATFDLTGIRETLTEHRC